MARFSGGGLSCWMWGAASAGALLLGATNASACGGFFCSASAPVEQAAERIIFALDDDGHVTQIVEVLYEGPSEEFSWVLPVPGVPDPSVSSSQVFDRLQTATDPIYGYQVANSCPSDALTGGDDGDIVVDAVGDPTTPPTVTVLDSGSVGPYDFETISVDAADEDPADVAVEWLENNGYDVGPSGADVLRPYLQNGLNLIAFRLTKGQSAGAIRPIVLEYDARAMAIPILPTAVAARDDMPILVWTLGAHRAVPTNYLGLELNELLIDWFDFRPTYDAVVTAAADEAGGQGFVTEYAGAVERFVPSIEPTEDDVDLALGTLTDELRDALEQITRQLGDYDGFAEAAEDHLTLREGVTLDDFVACAYCYFEGGTTSSGATLEPATADDPIYDTDLEAFRAALSEGVLQPFFDLADLMRENRYMTRLYTTMSADEMTKDPAFEFNPDAPEVSNLHLAQMTRDCDSDAWSMELPGGAIVYGNEWEWPYSLADAQFPANVRTLQFSTSGAPEVMTDNTDAILTLHGQERPSVMPADFGDDPDDGASSGGGGGCSFDNQGGPSPWAWLGFGLLGAVALRRRTV